LYQKIYLVQAYKNRLIPLYTDRLFTSLKIELKLLALL